MSFDVFLEPSSTVGSSRFFFSANVTRLLGGSDVIARYAKTAHQEVHGCDSRSPRVIEIESRVKKIKTVGYKGFE